MTAVEEVRKYWNTRPCNIRHSAQPIDTREYFEEVEKRKYFVEPHIPAFAQFARWKGKKVLEIGCGLGTDTINFARAGAEVTAVDLSEESLIHARKRAELFGYSIRFYRANAEELSSTVPVEEYDLVYSFGVIHHTPHPEKAISEIEKYLGPQGELKIMVYHRHSWKVFWIVVKYGKGFFWKIDKLIAHHSEAQTGCPVTFSYTKATVQKLLQGFKITDLHIEHIFPYLISEYVQYNYKKVWYFRYIPGHWFRWLEHEWGWHLCITARKA